MIETPRAALRAGEIAEVADFFSFGTNDLTQMTFGFSRDDVEGRMMDAYLELGLLPRNPFEVVDFDGVGELVRLGTERGRATRPGLKVGVCGEHGGDPASIGLFYEAGLDYVSCSPFRVPVARLSAAQAVLANEPPEAKKAPGAGPASALTTKVRALGSHRGRSRATGDHGASSAVLQLGCSPPYTEPTGAAGRPIAAEKGETLCRYAARALGWPQRRCASPRSAARCLRSRARISGSVVWALRQRM